MAPLWCRPGYGIDVVLLWWRHGRSSIDVRLLVMLVWGLGFSGGKLAGGYFGGGDRCCVMQWCCLLLGRHPGSGCGSTRLGWLGLCGVLVRPLTPALSPTLDRAGVAGRLWGRGGGWCADGFMLIGASPLFRLLFLCEGKREAVWSGPSPRPSPPQWTVLEWRVDCGGEGVVGVLSASR